MALLYHQPLPSGRRQSSGHHGTGEGGRDFFRVVLSGGQYSSESSVLMTPNLLLKHIKHHIPEAYIETGQRLTQEMQKKWWLFKEWFEVKIENRTAEAICVTGHKVMLPSLNAGKRLEKDQHGQFPATCSEQWALMELSADRVWQSSTNKQVLREPLCGGTRPRKRQLCEQPE